MQSHIQGHFAPSNPHPSTPTPVPEMYHSLPTSITTPPPSPLHCSVRPLLLPYGSVQLTALKRFYVQCPLTAVALVPFIVLTHLQLVVLHPHCTWSAHACCLLSTNALQLCSFAFHQLAFRFVSHVFSFL